MTVFAPLAQEVRLPQLPVRVIGIDLGTTNSTVAELVAAREGDPESGPLPGNYPADPGGNL